MPVLGADRAGPCRTVGPVIDELAEEFADTAKVGKLNVDENREAPLKFGIFSIPSILLFKNGEVVETLVGAQPKTVYEDALQRLAAS